jgi:molybdopterin/thiamine biosynthesis adenylyltransferase
VLSKQSNVVLQLVYLLNYPCIAAKNLALAGVKSVTLHDDGNVELWDLSSNFFLSEKDVGQNRAQACVQKLQELNNAVIISTLTGEVTKEQLSNFQVFEHKIDMCPSLMFFLLLCVSI